MPCPCVARRLPFHLRHAIAYRGDSIRFLSVALQFDCFPCFDLALPNGSRHRDCPAVPRRCSTTQVHSTPCLCLSIPFTALPTPFVSYPSRHIRHFALHVFAFAARRNASRASRRDSTAVRFEVTRYSALPPPCFSWECRPLLTAALNILSPLCFALASQPFRVFALPFRSSDEPFLSALCLCSSARLPAPRLRRFPTHLSYEPRHAFATPIPSERFVSVPLP